HHTPSSSSPASWRPMSRLTGTFQRQLFHHRLASTGSYASTMHRVPVYLVGLLAFTIRPFHQRASWRTCPVVSRRRLCLRLLLRRSPALGFRSNFRCSL